MPEPESLSADSLSAKRQRALAEVNDRALKRRLFTHYARLYDHSKPFGPDNIGAYEWQAAFHNAGADHPERLLMAANRVGKTMCAAAEVACHLTGEYPGWWKGKRFARPTKGWVGAESAEKIKEVPQEALLGKEGEEGTGWIPGSRILKLSLQQARIRGVVHTIHVRHVTGGTSIVTFKTYEQGPEKWTGSKLDFVWPDEEPKGDLGMAIYTESITRVMDNKGIVMMTATPLFGTSNIVAHFLNSKAPGIYVKNATWDDAPHLDVAERERLWESYPPHERETRTKGLPMMGTGAVFPIDELEITCVPFEIPHHFYRINGVDFGIDHPAASAFLAWDKDADTIYVYDCWKSPGQTPVYHASNLAKHGKWIPVSWPHDGLARDKGSGKALKDLYRNEGAYMLREHAHYPDERGNHVEPGLIEMFEYMRTGRFKIFNTQAEWFEEKRLYHRKDGRIIKIRDDIISATRIAFIMRRFARVKPPVVQARRKFDGPIMGPARWKGTTV